MQKGLDLTEWRALKTHGEQAILPSGLEVRLRRVGMLDLAERGEIPEELKPMLPEMTKMAERGMTADDMRRMGGLMNVVVDAALVWPEDLTASELSFFDRQAIFAWANETGRQLALFRRESGEFVEVALPSLGIRK